MTPAEAAKATRQARAVKAVALAKRRALMADIAEGKALDAQPCRDLAYGLGVRTLQLLTRDAVSLASDAALPFHQIKRIGSGIARDTAGHLEALADAADPMAFVAALEAQHAAELAAFDAMLTA